MKFFVKLALLCFSLVIAISGCTALSSLKESSHSASTDADPPTQSQPAAGGRFVFYDSYAKW